MTAMNRITLTLACSALAIAGCAGHDNSSGDDASRRAAAPGRLDVSVMRTAQANYVRFDTPAKLARETAKTNGAVVAGTVEGFARGRRFFSIDSKPINRVVMQVRVTDTIRADPRDVHQGRVYLEMWGGVGTDDPSARFAKAIPRGTPVMVFGDARLMPNDPKTQGVNDGHPSGSRLLSAGHPQSLVFEENTGASSPRHLVGGREDLQDFGPAWTKATTVSQFAASLRKELNDD
ncbi:MULTISPECIES: hypothetical protein [Actinomadura]|uniref:Secreted protein n=1 Tax=Actinomadura yumaensis TaxID=111807 RepID=A0ABW2CU20_9ACTN|nr:hypothetical protein [Actinomadura sp. J1-007]MWK34125.1 hypothetical protein [Actinomadura sp. J1-007]